jgi:hypothetical protein
MRKGRGRAIKEKIIDRPTFLKDLLCREFKEYEASLEKDFKQNKGDLKPTKSLWNAPDIVFRGAGLKPLPGKKGRV